ncbi:Uncharacterized protein BN1224_CV14_A_07100 [Chlamydia pneumoniae]|nr:Uncharacterized protein BN1224_Wien1_A_07080 [Chlamydia pneumoniae]CRI36064.1 Uncharacterized protein BN1224_CM1_A_07110 [Chlamydia pneumoniae]CRI37191.1 Uncharacterized protein BN1224_CV14_A_07100 [Chlamydia pneumoniae]CRI38319.1 Uncharacterized protein BN1224_CV15_C_01520 [Chlamydia pneumoniae]CRI39451.1 Uncharacterized protein BN1224_CWL011_A_07150 [Chlamydia pneumoniae]
MFDFMLARAFRAANTIVNTKQKPFHIHGMATLRPNATSILNIKEDALSLGTVGSFASTASIKIDSH